MIEEIIIASSFLLLLFCALEFRKFYVHARDNPAWRLTGAFLLLFAVSVAVLKFDLWYHNILLLFAALTIAAAQVKFYTRFSEVK
jgi:hypothetical protein